MRGFHTIKPFDVWRKERDSKMPQTPINAINTLFLSFVSTFSLVTAVNNFIEVIINFYINHFSFF